MTERDGNGPRIARLMSELATTYQVLVSEIEDRERPSGPSPWSLDELSLLLEAVTNVAQAMGGVAAFVDRLGDIPMRQVDMAHRGLASERGIDFTASSASIDKWTVVHELGHVWDARQGWRLSRALQDYTGGRTCWLAGRLKQWLGRCDGQNRWPGCNRSGYFYAGLPPAGSDRNFNRREDFAEALAAFVYPAEAQSRVERFRGDPDYEALLYYADYTQTGRWSFVDALLRDELAT